MRPGAQPTTNRPGARPPAGKPGSGKALKVPVNFYCTAPNAREVFLIGDFNDWNPTANPMEKRVDGTWFVQLPIGHGHHHYLFLVDGVSALDPKATGVGRNEKNERVSMVAVS